MTKAQELEKAEAIAQLRKWLKPGDTVYTILRHVSRSGMQRLVGVVVFIDGQPIHPNWSTAKALGRRVVPQSDGVICNGAGMDMGFELVYSLSQVLFGDGYKLKHHWL